MNFNKKVLNAVKKIKKGEFKTYKEVARLAAGQCRFRFLDLWIGLGKMISKACPVGNLFSFGVCESFNSGAVYPSGFIVAEIIPADRI